MLKPFPFCRVGWPLGHTSGPVILFIMSANFDFGYLGDHMILTTWASLRAVPAAQVPLSIECAYVLPFYLCLLLPLGVSRAATDQS